MRLKGLPGGFKKCSAERLVVPQGTRNHHVVATRADGLMLTQMSGAQQRLADVQQLAIPPHLFRGPAPTDACPQALNELLAIHHPVTGPRAPLAGRGAQGVPERRNYATTIV